MIPKKQRMAPQRTRSVLVIVLSRVQFPSASRIIPLTDTKKPDCYQKPIREVFTCNLAGKGLRSVCAVNVCAHIAVAPPV
jgi:hypothetical protein